MGMAREPIRVGFGDIPKAANPLNPKEQLEVLIEQVPPVSQITPSVQHIVKVDTS
jgi:hypothetical protein